jgi:HAD superfamily hydrolase (TIGR01549 family)
MPSPIRYLIFDLDGTLVDSALDFDLMREEIGLPQGMPILEALANMDAQAARRAWSVVERHELAGAERAVPFAGAVELVAALAERGVRQAVLTRNSRPVAEAMLRHVPFAFDRVVTREEGPVKPDPQSIWRLCEFWGGSPEETAMVGDSRFDLETGRRAGVYNVLYARGRDTAALEFSLWADYVLHSFEQVEEFFAWLERPGKRSGEEEI